MDLNITPGMRGSQRVPVCIVAAGLMWVGGFVDAFGFLTLRRVYLGNMSGVRPSTISQPDGRPAICV